jgi:membrane protein YdbS with pleckstrin-like domain
MKTIKTKEKQEKQLQDALDVVNKWKEKFTFSLVNLLFFIFVLFAYMVNPLLGLIPIVVLCVFILFFTQQSIRSHNYKKFHYTTYKSLLIIHEKINDL